MTNKQETHWEESKDNKKPIEKTETSAGGLEETSEKPGSGVSSPLEIDEQTLERLYAAEKELQYTKENLRATFEKLEFQNGELRRIQNDLESSRNHFFSLFEEAPVGYVVYDQKLIVSAANKAFLKLTDTKKEDVIGFSITRLITPESHDIFYLHHKKLRKTKEPCSCELLMLAKGSNIPVKIESNFHSIGCGNNIRSAVIDLSKEKIFSDELEKTIEELREAKEEAEKSDKLKTLFLNNLSHEIRTPMNAIIGFSEFLREGGIGLEESRHLTEIIRQSSNQLLSIIDGIISISTVEAGLAKFTPSQTNLNEMMRNVYKLLQPKIKGKPVTFRYNPMLTDQQAIVFADENKLSQVLLHLVDNALKFTERGFVEFGNTLKDDHLHFYVADTGIGIPPEQFEHIFKRFEQIETEQSKVKGGMGLGLPLVKAYIDLMGGSIKLESEPGKGTTISFTIAYQAVETKSSGGIKTADSNFPGKTKTILVAEDEINNFELTNVILSASGVNILHAWDGSQAVEMVKKNPEIDLVIMDIKMPVMNGYDATRQIKSIKQELPVIALTAYALQGDREKALECGCDDYLSKPFTLKDFQNKIMKYL